MRRLLKSVSKSRLRQIRNLFFSLLCAAAGAMLDVNAQDKALFEKAQFIFQADTMPYRVLLPAGMIKGKHYPLLLFLHGSGERGNDNELQLVHGAALFLRDSIRRHYPAIVIFPQCSKEGYWSNVTRHETDSGRARYLFRPDGFPTRDMAMLQRLLRELMRKYPVDLLRVYAGGLSMGAMGTYELVRRNPGFFAAAFAICGGADTSTAAQMKQVPWWIFHGGNDDVVVPSFADELVTALKRQGAAVKYTFYPGANHNSWDSAFAEPELLNWLFAQKRKRISDRKRN